MKENNNPEIQETFRFPHSPASKQPLLLQVNDDDDDDGDDDDDDTYDTYIVLRSFCPLKIKFDIQVYDWDRFSKNDLMGEVKHCTKGNIIRVLLCHILYNIKVAKKPCKLCFKCVSGDEISKKILK